MNSKFAASIKLPKLPGEATLSHWAELDFSDEAKVSNFAVKGDDCCYQKANMLTLESAHLERVRFNGCSFDKSRMADMRLDTCDISNCSWTNCKLNRVTLTNCKLTGFKLTDCRLADVVFDNCVGDLVQMCGTQFKKVCFKNCRLTGIDLRFCDLQEAAFYGCDLQQSMFYDANLQGTDLRGSQLLGIKANAKDLKGGIIDIQQSIDLARHLATMLGMQVKNTD